MSISASSLKHILQPAKGKERLSVLLKLCDLPSYWGEQDELLLLQEAGKLSIELGSPEERAKTVYLSAKYYSRKAQFPLAVELFNEALQLNVATGNKRGVVDCKIELGLIENSRSFFENALILSQESIELATQISYGKGLAEALHVKADSLQCKGALQEALSQAVKALDIYETMPDIAGIASSYYHLGVIYESMGNFEEALSNLDFALKIREDLGDRFGIAETLNETGIIHWKQSNHLEGTKQLFRALEIEQETGNRMGMAVSYNIIGNINSNLGNYEDAIKYYKLALDLCKELDRKRGIASAYYNIGIVHYELGEYDAALENHLSAMKLSNELGIKELICASHNYTGKVYAALGNYSEALRYQSRALVIGEELGDQRRIGIAHTGIGATYLYLGDVDKATEHLIKALKLGREMGEKTIIKDALFTLVEVCRKKKEFEQALEYFNQYHQVQHEISNESVQKQLTTLNFQHSMAVKEKESALLKEKNEEIQRYLHKLEISNNELKQFAHVAAHDLREPLRMISAYISLLEQSIGGNLDDNQKKFIGFAIDGSKRMELLIEDMLRLAKVDADPKIETIALSSVINEIKLNLDTLVKEKGTRLIAEELPSIKADRTQMLQLFQNIIGNGMKYNESETPTIVVKHNINGHQLHITVADNGIGIPAEMREKAFQIFQRVATAKKYAGSGIGLAICKKIVDSMGGKIWVEDNPGGGTVFNISFNNVLAS